MPYNSILKENKLWENKINKSTFIKYIIRVMIN